MIRYWLALLVASQRFFPPLLLEVAGVLLLTVNGTGPIVDAYGSTSAVLFLVSTWLTISLISIEDRSQLAVTTVNGRGAARVLLGAVAVALLAVLVGVAIGLVLPKLTGDFGGGAEAVLVGGIGQFAAGLVGVAVGLVCSRPVIRRTAPALGFAVLLAIAGFSARWLTPLNELLRLLASGRSAGVILVPVAGLAVVAAALVLVVATLVHQVAIRRD